MMRSTVVRSITLLAFYAMAGTSAIAVYGNVGNTSVVHRPDPMQGVIVSYPWAFDKGNESSRTMAQSFAEEVGRKARYQVIPADMAETAWKSNGLPDPEYGDPPTKSQLTTFGQAVHANKVLYGSVSWNTRSIWVGDGPKTISTATVNAYVFNVDTGENEFKNTRVMGRSDEKLNGLKIVGDVLVTPLISAVSGGPATPREQRAAQIALSRAFHRWVRSSR